MALVRIHTGHTALCDLEDAAAQADRVSFAKVASIFTPPLADAEATHDTEKAPRGSGSNPGSQLTGGVLIHGCASRARPGTEGRKAPST